MLRVFKRFWSWKVLKRAYIIEEEKSLTRRKFIKEKFSLFCVNASGDLKIKQNNVINSKLRVMRKTNMKA